VLVQVLVLEGVQALEGRGLHARLVRVKVQGHSDLQLSRPGWWGARGGTMVMHEGKAMVKRCRATATCSSAALGGGGQGGVQW